MKSYIYLYVTGCLALFPLGSKASGQKIESLESTDPNVSFYFGKSGLSELDHYLGPNGNLLYVRNNTGGTLDTVPLAFFEGNSLIIKVNDSLLTILVNLDIGSVTLASWNYDGREIGYGRIRGLPQRVPFAGVLIEGQTYYWHEYRLLSADRLEVHSRSKTMGEEREERTVKTYQIKVDKPLTEMPFRHRGTMMDMLEEL